MIKIFKSLMIVHAGVVAYFNVIDHLLINLAPQVLPMMLASLVLENLQLFITHAYILSNFNRRMT